MTGAHPAPFTQGRAWAALATHYGLVHKMHLRQLFADDPHRGERLTAEAAGLYLDYSKNRITDETLGLLFRLAEECALTTSIEAMFRGDKINLTETRAVLHVALRLFEVNKYSLMAMTSCPTFTWCSIRWPAFLSRCETACGKVTQASEFAM
jgi:Phosphoglucose isomerase